MMVHDVVDKGSAVGVLLHSAGDLRAVRRGIFVANPAPEKIKMGLYMRPTSEMYIKPTAVNHIGVFAVDSMNWLPELDGKRTSKAQVIQLLIAMYKYRGRHTQIVFGEPLQAKQIPPKPVLKNIVAEALKVKAFLTEDPQRTFRHAGEHFKVTKARISQLMKIADVLPQEFVAYMGGCGDQAVIRKFSGKTLLRIAGLESPNRRQEVTWQAVMLLRSVLTQRS